MAGLEAQLVPNLRAGQQYWAVIVQAGHGYKILYEVAERVVRCACCAVSKSRWRVWSFAWVCCKVVQRNKLEHWAQGWKWGLESFNVADPFVQVRLMGMQMHLYRLKPTL